MFFRGMITWLGFKHASIPFFVSRRISGRSSQFITVAAILFAIFAILLGVQTLYKKFTGIAVVGFTTVIILLLIIGSALMISLGIIGIYIAKIYDEVKHRPRYVISDSIGDDKI
ncbi:MAG: hypothetical protein AB1765_09245 [Candidatus Hydrogenedentota bacterium]